MIVYTRTPKSKRKRKPNQETVIAKRLKKPKFKEKSKPVEQRYRAPGTDHIPSKIDEHLATHAPKQVQPIRYEDEMAAREAAAQEEIKRKSKCVAPAFNKGNYTYIATEEQAKWVGRK